MRSWLRAPSRAIDGFGALLLHDHAAEMGDEAQRKLGVIRSEAVRLGKVIDGLLDFFKRGRSAIRAEALDMSALARAAFEQLQRAQPGATVELRLGELPAAHADPMLVAQVWANLLSNAIKFSSREARAVIEIEGVMHASEAEFVVRDNGAGFDAAYRDRLFGVFQRLHHDHEFPGTGVGLALVHRIVTRHGGRVWADGELGRGATFHFTVPKEAAGGGV
jgi:light-regulated signal transduction histidine kinase (bacteriophytochrome)